MFKNRYGKDRWRFLTVAALALLAIGNGLLLPPRSVSAQSSRPRLVTPAAAHSLVPSDHVRVTRILADLEGVSHLPTRLKMASHFLLGTPYLAYPLRGSITQPEELVTRTDGFDCVTFLETVLAFGLSSHPNQFVDTLRLLRYQDGRIDFQARHHYMTDWHRANRTLGLLRELIPQAETREELRTLSVIEGLPPRLVTLRYLPRSRISRLAPQVEDGDLIYFLTSRQGIDAFHTGLLFWVDGTLRLRHASRRRRQVIEEDLSHFLRYSPPAGVVLLHPLPLKPSAS